MAAIPLATGSVSAGFTLLELLVTMLIMGIVLAIGVPQFSGIIADQRVRTAISDLRGDLIFARADAINNQERVVVEAIDGSDWNKGWRVCVAPTSYDCSDPTKILRVGEALDEHLKSCGSSASLVALAFRPDGRLDLNPPFTGSDYIRISDDLRDSDASDDKIRTLYFGLNGRIAEMNENGDANGVTPC